MSRTTTVVTALAAATALTLTAQSANAAAAAHARAALTVSANSKHVVTVASTTRPGVVRLHNSGSREIFVFKRRSSGVDYLAKVLNRDGNGTAIFSHYDLVDVVAAHGNDFVTLARGTYYVGDITAGTYRASLIRTLRVTGSTSNASLPRTSPVVIDAGRGVHTSGHTTAHNPWLDVVNHSGQVNDVLLFPVAASKTDKQVSDFLAAPTDNGLEDLVDQNTKPDFLIVGARRVLISHRSLAKGRYLVVTLTPSDTSLARKGRVALLRTG